jgi:hypothetical protein
MNQTNVSGPRVSASTCGGRHEGTDPVGDAGEKGGVMEADVISVDLPMTFKRRGGRKVIVLPDGTQGSPAPKATIDNTDDQGASP